MNQFMNKIMYGGVKKQLKMLNKTMKINFTSFPMLALTLHFAIDSVMLRSIQVFYSNKKIMILNSLFN